jgi:hypothetical protein
MEGTVPGPDRNGIPGGSLYFNGSTTRVILPSEFDFLQRSVTFWVMPTEIVLGSGIPYDSDNPSLLFGHTWFSLVEEGGLDKIALGVGDQLLWYTRPLIDTWTFLACVVEQDWVKLYVHGSLRDSMPNTSFAVSEEGSELTYVGCNRQHNYHLKGYLDDMRIYNVALSAEEIMDMGPYAALREENVPALRVWPNPAGRQLFIDAPGATPTTNAQLTIFNGLGQCIFSGNLQEPRMTVDVSTWTTGLYLTRIVAGGSTGSALFYKE